MQCNAHGATHHTPRGINNFGRVTSGRDLGRKKKKKKVRGSAVLLLCCSRCVLCVVLVCVPLAAGLRVVYKNGVGPSIRFKNRDDDATEEVLRLPSLQAEYLQEKLREKKPELLSSSSSTTTTTTTTQEAKAKAGGGAAADDGTSASSEDKSTEAAAEESSSTKKAKKKKKKAASSNTAKK